MKYLTFLCLVAYTSAHMCLISPPQRGSMMGLNKAGSDDCILISGPCGGRPARRHALEIEAGANFTVTFQKNLDHWLKKSPGFFNISLLQNETETLLAKVPDMGEPSLTLYSRNVTMPKGPMNTPLVLQATYVTMNHDAPPVFYQCSDIQLYGKK